MEIIAVRHAIAEGNPQHVFLGRTDTPLTACGVELARKRQKELPRVALAYHSPMLRARETARLLWPEAEMHEVAGLREMDFGLFDGRAHGELMEDETYRAWLAQGAWEGYPGGETFAAAEARCEEAFQFIVRDAHGRGLSRVGAVMHGGSLMLVMKRHTKAKFDFTDFPIKNCEGFLLEADYREGQARVLRWERI